jgi:hypothetical protein
METVILRGEDFKTVHNTLCELRSVQQRLTGVISNELADHLHMVVKGFDAGLANAYEQEHSVFNSKMKYYDSFKTENKLRSTWSIYELPIHGFLEDHPYPSDAFVIYTQHWGENENKHYPVQGASWGDLYRAADLAIRNSGDDHHCFIERFSLKNGNELHLSTGS